MNTAYIIVSVVLAAMCVMSASQKLRKSEQTVAIISETVGVPLRLFPLLGTLLLAGAAGLIAGIWIRPLGVAAAAGLSAYFLAAIIGHLRVGDRKGTMMPLPTFVLSAAALVLGIATL